ncbi:MAG: hypothetical protein ABI282_00755 [Candidatus Baltobacteraceae bacterium]
MLAAVTLSLQVQRATLDLLDGLNIEIAAHNSAGIPVDVRFTEPLEYAIDVLHGADVVWTSTPATPSQPTSVPPHTKRLLPGPSVLAIYIWNEETKDNASVAPGDYVVRVRLLGDGITPQATVNVHFISPTPISALGALHLGDALTIAGRFDPVAQTLTDTTGNVKLTKRLPTAPTDEPIAVRGYSIALPDRTRAFFVERWARIAKP